MFKVMIIDDEPMIRKGIRTMVNWKEHDCEVVDEASDGVEGIDKIRACLPDIIITDIRMPEMDGLTMIKEVKALIPHSKIIILTGFRDFDYVYEAIQVGAFGFTLKPSKIAELDALISRAVTELRFSMKREEEIQKLRLLLERNMPILREKLLFELLYGYKDINGDIEGRMKLFNLEINHFLMMMVVCETGEEHHTMNAYDRHVYQFGVIKSVEEIFGTSFRLLSIPCNDKDSVFILSIPEKHGDYMNTINEKCLQLQEMVRQCFNMVLTIAISSDGNSSAEIHSKYNECLQALSYKHYAGAGSVIQFADLNSFFHCNDNPDIRGVQDRLMEQIKSGNEEGTRDALKELSACFERHAIKNPESVKGYFKSLLNEINTIRLSVMAVDSDRGDETPYNLEGLYRIIDTAVDINSMIEIFSEAAQRVTGRINRYNTRSIKQIIKKAMAYIQEHYQEQLTLNDIASHVYVSPSYVSRMFSRELNKNFVDYINEVRIEKAKELLRDVRYKTYEIADRVGIQDARYFSRLFKKHTNMTPTEYRDSL